MNWSLRNIRECSQKGGECDMVTSYYVVFRITVHVIAYKVYLVLDIMYVLVMVSWNIFDNCGGA